MSPFGFLKAKAVALPSLSHLPSGSTPVEEAVATLPVMPEAVVYGSAAPLVTLALSGCV